MDKLPEWISAITSGLIAIGGLSAWIIARRERYRLMLPNVQADWMSGASGFTVRIAIDNLLEEDLIVERVCAPADIVQPEYSRDEGGSITGQEWHALGRCIHPDLRIGRGQSGQISVTVEGAETPREIWLTVSSSKLALRSRRIRIAETQRD